MAKAKRDVEREREREIIKHNKKCTTLPAAIKLWAVGRMGGWAEWAWPIISISPTALNKKQGIKKGCTAKLIAS